MAKEFDIAGLLQYEGPSKRHERPVQDGIGIVDYRDSDDNERKISTLLSAKDIPFHIERASMRNQIRMTVTVPRSLRTQAEALLSAAADVMVLDKVEGIEGLRSR